MVGVGVAVMVGVAVAVGGTGAGGLCIRVTNALVKNTAAHTAMVKALPSVFDCLSIFYLASPPMPLR